MAMDDGTNQDGAEVATDAAAEADSDDEDDPFESMVLAALESLPESFRARLGRVAIAIEDDPSPELLTSIGAPGLFGLYQGVPMTTYGAEEAAFASKITIYRNSHLQIYRDPDALARGVADTVRHEIAHHFGISDARLEELERERQSQGRGHGRP